MKPIATNSSAGRKTSLCSDLFKQIYRHPILSAAMLCLLCMIMTTGGVSFLSAASLAVCIALAGIGAALHAKSIYEGDKGIRMAVSIGTVAVLTAVIFVYNVLLRQSYTLVVMNGSLAACVGVFLYLLGAQKLSTRNILLLLLAAGFIMRVSYILTMTAGMIQHDVYSLGDGAGHAGYIEYLYANGHLPDFDVREIDQFYHPPLHHIIAALWMHLQTLIGVTYAEAYENIQILTLFYSTVCLILSYKIFRCLGLYGGGLLGATAIIAFCPTFYIMSGSINNDILSITFALGAILNTLYWYRSRSIKRILAIALCIGLGMMTKLSVWMVAPAIAFVFIYVFFTNLKDLKKYIVQFSAFICVCAPIGLFWSVRNFLRWQVPFTYVQRLSEKASQYIGDVPFWQRMFDLSPHQFADVSPQFTMYKNAYNEYNPLIAFFKTSVFDESIAVRRFPKIQGFSHVLFFAAVILGLIAFGAMIFMLIKKVKSPDVVQKAFVFLLFTVFLGMYYSFCFDFPHVCTMNVRYGVPLLVIGAFSYGFLLQHCCITAKRSAKIGVITLSSFIALYALSGFFVYNICAVSRFGF